LSGEVTILDQSATLYPTDALSTRKRTTIRRYYTVEFDGDDDIAHDEYRSGAELIAALSDVAGTKSFQPNCVRNLLKAVSHKFGNAEVAEVECHVEIRLERSTDALVEEFDVMIAAMSPLSTAELTSTAGRRPGRYEYIEAVRADGVGRYFLPARMFDWIARGSEHGRLQTELRRTGVIVGYFEPRFFRPSATLRLSRAERRSRTVFVDCFEIDLNYIKIASSELDLSEDVARAREAIATTRETFEMLDRLKG
jgi:hypothetical protein